MANEIRKTSIGMQAVAAGPLLGDEPSRHAPKSGSEHAIGMLVTLGIHGGLVAIIVIMNIVEHNRPKLAEPPPQAIEAGLAIKRQKTEKKSNMPQKDLAPKVKPPDPMGIAHNPDAVPPPDKKKKDQPPPDATDSKSVFEKYRRMDTGETQQSENEGSEYGTLERAKGDPYVGELIGRMTSDFVVPTVVTDQSLETWGCVKLDENGKIADRAIDPEKKSKSHAFNSAVEDALKRATDMEKPVPNYLKAMLVGKFVCATYTSKRE